MTVLEEDFISILDRLGSLKEELKDSTIFVTGATGLVGSLLIRSAAFMNRKEDLVITIYGLARDEKKVQAVYGDDYDSAIHFLYGEVTDDFHSYYPTQASADYIFHTASVTASKIMVEKPVETIFTAVDGTNEILSLAKEKVSKSVVYVSSMEMYGSFSKEDPAGSYCTEDKLGFVDPLRVRSDYPEGKRMCENLCTAYLSEYKVPVKIARLAQSFGPGILPWENRVFAQFARSVMEGKDIVLHTKGLSEGNYCYSADMVYGLFMILLRGINGEAYNVVNEDTHTTIADMAKMCAEKLAEGKIQVVFDIPQENTFGYAADTHLRLSQKKLESLGWKPMYDLEIMYQRTIRYLGGSV